VRITVLANRDLHGNRVLDRLLRALPEHRLSVVLSERVGRGDGLPPPLATLALHEQGLLRRLVEPLLGDAPEAPTLTFAGIARRLDGRCAVVNRPRSAEGRAALLAEDPELVLSIRYGGILDAAHAAAVPHGILNLHSGALPDHRGILASLHAVLAGATALTATVHRIVDAGIDTGPVIDAVEVPLEPERSLLWNIARLYDPGADALVDAVRRLQAGEALPGEPQDPDAGAYHGLPDARTLAEFAGRGHRLTDLADTLELLERRYLDAVP
jgi:methionyl-tRNA formyltransferase